MICLSKSIGGYGLPLAITLIRPDLDVWAPGEHNGTFRGVNPAFVTAAEALRTYWQDDDLEKSTKAKGERVAQAFTELVERYPEANLVSKGRGLARGLEFENGELASKVCAAAFERGLLMETSGPDGEVVKLLPALTTTEDEIEQGLSIIAESVDSVLSR
jgi:diaminobutyrate-2-oxoglutarate transaminase